MSTEILKTTERMVLGEHIIVEAIFRDASVLDDPEALLHHLDVAARKGGMTVLDKRAHKFSPQGVTAFVLLAESHVSIHTWPEHRYAALDIYTCGKDPEGVYRELIERLPIERVEKVKILRGPTI